jgi:hypothetical protein
MSLQKLPDPTEYIEMMRVVARSGWPEGQFRMNDIHKTFDMAHAISDAGLRDTCVHDSDSHYVVVKWLPFRVDDHTDLELEFAKLTMYGLCDSLDQVRIKE